MAFVILTMFCLQFILIKCCNFTQSVCNSDKQSLFPQVWLVSRKRKEAVMPSNMCGKHDKMKITTSKNLESACLEFLGLWKFQNRIVQDIDIWLPVYFLIIPLSRKILIRKWYCVEKGTLYWKKPFISDQTFICSWAVLIWLLKLVDSN